MLLILLATLITTALNLGATFYNVRLLRQLRPPKDNKEYSVSIVSLLSLLHTQRSSVHTGWIDADYPPELQVHLPTVGLSIVEGPHFTLHADADWGTIFPAPNEGFIQLGPHKRWFIPSIYHQLHCLDAIRVAYVVNGSYAPQHTQHCLRYLRQAVLCNADTTLEETEWVENANGTMVPAADGVGMIHKCRDWTVLRKWMEENA